MKLHVVYQIISLNTREDYLLHMNTCILPVPGTFSAMRYPRQNDSTAPVLNSPARLPGSFLRTHTVRQADCRLYLQSSEPQTCRRSLYRTNFRMNCCRTYCLRTRRRKMCPRCSGCSLKLKQSERNLRNLHFLNSAPAPPVPRLQPQPASVHHNCRSLPVFLPARHLLSPVPLCTFPAALLTTHQLKNIRIHLPQI